MIEEGCDCFDSPFSNLGSFIGNVSYGNAFKSFPIFLLSFSFLISYIFT
jgi:hypothetical protein